MHIDVIDVIDRRRNRMNIESPRNNGGTTSDNVYNDCYVLVAIFASVKATLPYTSTHAGCVLKVLAPATVGVFRPLHTVCRACKTSEDCDCWRGSRYSYSVIDVRGEVVIGERIRE